MSERTEPRRGLVTLFAALVLVAAAVVVVRRAKLDDDGSRLSEGVQDLLAAVPAGSFLVATADVAALRKSPLYAAVFGGDGSRALGLSGVDAACGFDPLSRVSEAAFVVPEEGDSGEFGVAARMNVTPDEIQSCAEKLSAKKTDGAASSLAKVGDYYVMQAASASLPKLAYKPESGSRGLLIVGKGEIVAMMIDAESGKRPRLEARGGHQRLRAALSSPTAPTVTITAILPESMRARVRAEMAPELEKATGVAKDQMSGVLSVGNAGAALVTGDVASTTELRAVLDCDSADGCTKVAAFIDKKKRELQQNYLLRLLAGSLFDGATIEPRGTRVTVHASMPTADAARVVSRLLGMRSREPDEPAPSAPRSPSSSAPLSPRVPDETLRADAPAKSSAPITSAAQRSPPPAHDGR